VASMSRLTAEGISTAMSLGEEVIAVTVVFTDDDDTDGSASREATFRAEWNSWRSDVPLISLKSSHRSIAGPIISFLRSIEEEDKYHRLVVLIPEVQPATWWSWLFYNQRGIILASAIRRGTTNVVLCRLRYRLSTLTSEATPPEKRVAR
jgi:hypothetical protein